MLPKGVMMHHKKFHIDNSAPSYRNIYLRKIAEIGKKKSSCLNAEVFFFIIINRSGVAGAVLQTAKSLFKSFRDGL